MRLSTKATIWVSVFSIFFVVVGLQAVRIYRAAFEGSVQTVTAEHSATALKLVLNQSLDREWDSLSAIARQADAHDPVRLKRMAEVLPRASDRLSWAGFVNLGGIIEVGTGDAEVGTSVSRTHWFASAKSGPALSDLLTRKVDGKTQSFLNLAYPVRALDGHTEGVIVYRLKMSWVSSFLASNARSLGVDAYLVDSSGEVIAGSDAVLNEPLNAKAINLAKRSFLRDRPVTEPDRKGFVDTVIPRAFGQGARGNNWGLIVRVPLRTPVAVGGAAWQQAEYALIGVALAVALCLIAALRMFLRPIEIQTTALAKLAQGKMVYPKEFRSSREARELGASLALLQTLISGLQTNVGAGAPSQSTPAHEQTETRKLKPILRTAGNSQSVA